MMRKQYVTPSQKTGRFGEIVKKLVMPGLEPGVCWLRTSSFFIGSVGEKMVHERVSNDEIREQAYLLLLRMQVRMRHGTFIQGSFVLCPTG